MAATLFREAYDCIVLGSGRTAAQVAAAVARTGRQTLQLAPEARAPYAWLHPRFVSVAELDLERLPISSVCAVSATGKPIATVHAAAGLLPPRMHSQSPPATAFTLPVGCAVACESNHRVRLNGALPPTEIQANAVIRVERAVHSDPATIIGGVYRDVASLPSTERQATLFATRREGEVCWLVPIAGAQWSLGLVRPQAKTSLAAESPAELLEEALVACPALTQRLIAAELVGDLHVFTEPDGGAAIESSQDVLTLPNYDQWLDPVFASGDWLSRELAQQFVAQLSTAKGDDQRIADWLASWPAVEQLTRERIAPWYQLPATLPETLHDHAQREWYERLLLAQ